MCASFSEHKTVCNQQIQDCGQCTWQDKCPRITNQLERWIKDFDQSKTFMDKRMAGLRGSFGIGCLTCHKISPRRSMAFATFSVSDPTMMRANTFFRHLQSASHLEAQARSLNGHPSYSESSELKMQLGVQAPCRFVWAMQSCFNCASFRNWSKQNMQRDGLDEECLQDSSSKICRQLLFAISMPVTIKNQELLQKAMRVALSVDDKDPAFLCGLKLVVTSPATQCHRLFGRVLKD